MKKPIFALIIAAGGLVLPVLPAVAVPLPPGVSDEMTVFNKDGVVIVGVGTSETREGQNHNELVPIFPEMVAANPSKFGHPMFVTDGAGGLTSDVFGVAKVVKGGNTIYELAFISDDNLSESIAAMSFGPKCCDAMGHNNWIDKGNESEFPYDITDYIDPKACSGCTGFFQSDLNVPDGGMTITLLATALVGIGILRRILRAATA